MRCFWPADRRNIRPFGETLILFKVAEDVDQSAVSRWLRLAYPVTLNLRNPNFRHPDFPMIWLSKDVVARRQSYPTSGLVTRRSGFPKAVLANDGAFDLMSQNAGRDCPAETNKLGGHAHAATEESEHVVGSNRH